METINKTLYRRKETTKIAVKKVQEGVQKMYAKNCFLDHAQWLVKTFCGFCNLRKGFGKGSEYYSLIWKFLFREPLPTYSLFTHAHTGYREVFMNFLGRFKIVISSYQILVQVNLFLSR